MKNTLIVCATAIICTLILSFTLLGMKGMDMENSLPTHTNMTLEQEIK